LCPGAEKRVAGSVATGTVGNADALKAAGDIIKVSTGLATGSLIFSVGLIGNAPSYSLTVRVLLVVSWILLAISIIVGVLSQAAIPVLMAHQDYNIEDKYFTYPGRVHQTAFVIAIIVLSIALFKMVYSEPTTLRVPTAVEAVSIARNSISNKYDIERLSKIELIKAPSDRPSATTWRAEFEVTQKHTQGGSEGPSHPHSINVFIDALRGNTTIIE
jgi:hypothetical protein